jgi:uncharacterized protein (DUF2147 family)
MIKSFTVPAANSPKFTRVLRAVASAAAITLASATAASATPAEDILGVWYDDTGRGAVEISRCGESLCGHIVWLQSNVSSRGGPLRDRNNPNTSRQNRPICGLQVIGGLSRQPDGTWDQGRIYDPKVGKEYDVAVSPIGGGRLAVTGYVGIKLLSRTIVWTRAPDDIERCKA